MMHILPPSSTSLVEAQGGGSFPWDCVRFLDHAAKLRFIQRVGGRYRFMHDLLRKHFASGELPSYPSR